MATAAALKVPTVFSAIDKVSAPVRVMANNVQNFAERAETGIGKAHKAFNKFLPSISSIGKEIMNAVFAFGLFTAVAAGITYSAKAVMDYEDAIASFRTIVANLNNKEFEQYKVQVGEVATRTKRSTIEVAQSFERIAGLNAEFAKTAQGLSAVSEASITLAKAGRIDLGQAADSLVGIMNQFGLSATEANRTINVLAAGVNVGASSIAQTSDAFANFGSVAKGANISLEQSVALIELLGQKSLFGAEAGTKLRGAVLKLQQAGVGYKSGQFQINDALEQARAKFDKLSTAKAQDAYLNKLFGAENITAGRILLTNIETYKQFTAAVTDTNAAQVSAAINSNTLSGKLQELNASWVNMTTTSDKASSGLNTAKNIIGFLADNLDTVVRLATYAAIAFVGIKTALWAAEAAMFAYNVVLGVSNALSTESLFLASSNAVAQTAYAFTTRVMVGALWLWETAQWAVNAALSANPIGLIVIAIAAAAAAVYLVTKNWEKWGAAVSLSMGPIGGVLSLIMSLKKHWSDITTAFKDGGIISGLKAIASVMLEAIVYPLQQAWALVQKITGASAGPSTAASKASVFQPFYDKYNLQGVTARAPALSTKQAEQENFVQRYLEQLKQMVNINIKDETGRASVNSKGNVVPINLSSTTSY